ncbi:type II toxin-antitoxin system HipA family toxin [Porcincola intestinalis]|uniref:type II toxin-antitoxin system HipA family toxin n=1 Tax=Porcincola intestinalis TaxID=2606632 RepID=UPI002A90EB0C|nr:type II toxin-antitoxin system HipA family toxin [Porcincola intestinalis]MDY5579728.1 type II toxin-antitoxin system HipA family toxin [Porcincola intestinalis]
MIDLHISIEKNGEQTKVGIIQCSGISDAVFRYDKAWLDREDAIPVSLSLPLQEEAFSSEKTKCFFEGLLPEGFTKRSVARWMHADEHDYLTMLSGLGQECLGAIQVVEGNTKPPKAKYTRMTEQQLQELAAEGAIKSAELVTALHLSLAGASGKTGLYFDAGNKCWYLPVGTAPSTHIVKQSHVRFKDIVTNEQLCLTTAKNLGIPVPSSFAVNTEDENLLFATPRYDRVLTDKHRVLDGLPVPYRLHQEDMAQALGIPTENKYEIVPSGYSEKICGLLRDFSSNPIRDILDFWNRIIFNDLIGNTDGHLKNFSFLYDKNLAGLHLAPAYDIVSTTIYPGHTRTLSMYIGESHDIDQIQRNDFVEGARRSGIQSAIILRQLDTMAENFEKAINQAADALQEKGYKNAGTIRDRILETSGYRYL